MADRSLGYSVTAIDKASATFVKMAMQVDRLAQRLDALDRKRTTVTVDADTKPAERKIETLDKSFGAATIRVAALGRAMSTLALPGAIAAATPMLASLGSSAVSASGALLLLPGAGFAGAAAMTALKVGTAGWGEAMKNLDDPEKFAEAISKLSPAARAAAVEVRGLMPAWLALQGAVQDRLFAGAAAEIGRLAGVYLPVLRTGLVGVAGELNVTGMAFGRFATEAATVSLVEQAFKTAATSVRLATPGALAFAAALRDIGAEGLLYLPGLANGFTSVGQRFAAFIAQARASGQLGAWIEQGIATLQQLGQVAFNVGSILGSIFGAAERSGESFLSILVRVTGQLAGALRTPQGAAALEQVFVVIRTVTGALVEKLIALWPAISAAGQALGALLMSVAPLSGVLTTIVVAGLVPMLDAIRVLAPVLGPAVVLFGALRLALTVATTAMTIWRAAVGIATATSVAWQLAMGTNLVLTEAQTAALTRHAVAARVAGAAAAVWAAGQWVVAAAQNGTLLSTIRLNAAVAASLAMQAIAKGAALAWAGAQWVLNAALTANPIGLIVVAIAALVAGLVWAWNNSETFRAIVIGAWEAIRATAVAVFGWLATNIPAIWNGIVSSVTSAWNGVVNFFTTVVGAVVDFFREWGLTILAVVMPVIGIPILIIKHWDSIVAFFATLPQRIVHGLGFLAGFLLRAAIEGWAAFTTGLETAWTSTVAFLTALPGRIGAFLTGLGATLLTWAITAWGSFTTGLETAWTSTVAFFASLPNRIGSFLTGLGVSLLTSAVTAWAGFTAGLESAWTGTVAWFAGLPGRIEQFLFNLGVILRNRAVLAWAAFTNGLESAWSSTIAWLSALPARIGAFFASAGSWLLQTGADLVLGLWNGLTGAWTGLLTWIGGLISTFIDGFKAGLGVASPSTIFAEIGNWLIQGLIAGLQAAAALLWTVLTAIATGVVDLFMAGVNLLTGLWSTFWAGLQLQVAIAWSTISAYVQAGWAFVQALFNAAVAFVVGIWTNFWLGLQMQVSMAWTLIQTAIQVGWTFVTGLFNTATAFLSTIWSAFWLGIQTALSVAWSLIQAIVAAGWAVLTGAFNVAVAFIAGLWSMFWSGLQTVAATVWAAISGFFAAALAAFQALWSAAWATVSAVFTAIWQGIQAAAVAVWTAISTFFSAAFAAYQALFAAVWNAVLLVFRTVWTTLQTVATTIWNAIAAFFSAAFAAYQAAFSAIWNAIVAVFTAIWESLRNVATTAWNAISAFFTGAFAAFSAFFSSTWQNIVATFDRIWSGITDIAKRVWDAVRGAFVAGVNTIIDVINGFAGAINKVAGLLGFSINLGIPRLAGGGAVQGLADGGQIHYRQVIHRAAGGNTSLRRGGRLPYTGVRRDTIPAFAGRQPYALMGEEFVVRRTSTRAIGAAGMDAINNADQHPVDIVPRRSGGPVGPPTPTVFGRPLADRTADQHGAFLHALADGQAEAVQATAGYGSPRQFVKALDQHRSRAVRNAGGRDAGVGQYQPRLFPDPIMRDLGGAIAFARSMNGRPYIWGGTTTAGTDCCIVGPVRVYGDFGAKPISEIRPGDEVYSYVDGKLVTNPVTAAWQSKTQPVFKVRTRNRAITASANHPFLRLVEVEATRHVEGRRGRLPARYDTEWVRLDQLARGDLLIQPRDLSTEALSDPALQDGTPIDADVAWLIGLTVGDGTVIGRGVRICVYGEDRERADRIARQRWGGNPGWSQKHGMVIHSKALHDSLAAIGLELRGSDKRVPAAVWSWPAELQRAFVNGYCDADGHRPADTSRHGQRTYHSASRELIEDVRALHITLGDAVSNVSETKRTKPIVINGKTVTNPLPLHSFTVWNGKRTGETTLRKDHPGVGRWIDEFGDFTVARILDVTAEGVQDTYDLTVEGSHNFIADGVVVHNSGYQGMITNVLRNRPPARIGTTASFPWPGFRPGLNSVYAIGSKQGNPGHMAGTLAGVNVESGGSPSRVKYGAGAVGADHGQFTTRASLPEVGGVFASGGAGGFAALIRPIVEALLKPLRDRLVPIRDNQAEGMGKRMVAGTGVKLLDFLVEKATAADGAGAGAPGVGPVADQVRAVAARYGWDQGAEWAAIDYIVGRESSWDPNAKNPNSSAYGLFQLIAANQGGGGASNNPGQQAEAGLRYIQQRYGTPTAARRFWDANGHYDNGGVARGRGILLKDTIQPERMLDPRQTRQHERLTDVLASGGVQRLLTLAERTAARNPVLAQVARIGAIQAGAGGVSVTVDSAALATEVTGLRVELAALQRLVREARPVNVYADSRDITETGHAVALRLRI